MAADSAYKNAQKHSDKQNARIENDKAFGRVIIAMMNDDTKLFKQFVDNQWFKRFVRDTVFGITYEQPAAAGA